VTSCRQPLFAHLFQGASWAACRQHQRELTYEPVAPGEGIGAFRTKGRNFEGDRFVAYDETAYGAPGCCGPLSWFTGSKAPPSSIRIG
jgi:hypothetical protein